MNEILILIKQSSSELHTSCVDPEGYRGSGPHSPPPEKNHKTIGFLGNTGPDPLKKKYKSTKPAFKVGPSWIAGGQMMARFWFGSSLLSLINYKKVVIVGPPLTKLSGSAHAVCACMYTVRGFSAFIGF